MMGALCALAVTQAGLILAAPALRAYWPFSWYYRVVFRPVLQDTQRHRWKYWAIPAFYAGVYAYCVWLFYGQVYAEIASALWVLERWMLPAAVAAPAAVGVAAAATPAVVAADADYDGLLFHDGVECRTCRVRKPARSRHCAVCGRCVPLADHHCVWLNNCVGRGNYGLFYVALGAHCALLMYGAVRLPLAAPAGRWPRALLALELLVASFAALCVWFTATQFAMVRDGMTANEQDKWYTVQESMRQGLLVRLRGRFYYRVEGADGDEFYSTNAYDHRKYALHGEPYAVVTSHEEIPNVYDAGSFWANLRQRLDPHAWILQSRARGS
ncbi:AaceriAGR065Wp [[Ashbya] aceris (nom. inval.)]|nr:AaceriAGR065Wp [[Ashbya] aceris (nom. inval.)]